MAAVKTRWMVRRDMAEVLSIESKSFETPWCEPDFLGMLRKQDTIGIVADSGDAVVGFAIYRLRKDRVVIENIAVHPDWRSMGVGTMLVDKLKGKLKPQHRTAVELFVPELADYAIRFFAKRGFRAQSVGESGDGISVYLMRYEIPELSISELADQLLASVFSSETRNCDS